MFKLIYSSGIFDGFRQIDIDLFDHLYSLATCAVLCLTYLKVISAEFSQSIKNTGASIISPRTHKHTLTPGHEIYKKIFM